MKLNYSKEVIIKAIKQLLVDGINDITKTKINKLIKDCNSNFSETLEDEYLAIGIASNNYPMLIYNRIFHSIYSYSDKYSIN